MRGAKQRGHQGARISGRGRRMDMEDMEDMKGIIDGGNQLSDIERLLTAASFRDDPDCWERITIARRGRELLAFRIRPLDEQEVADMRRECTRFAANPAGRQYPRIEGEVDLVRLRSLKIYRATVAEDRARLWDDAEAMRKLGVMRGEDMVDCVLMAGEKDAVIERIDALSGYGAQVGERIKN